MKINLKAAVIFIIASVLCIGVVSNYVSKKNFLTQQKNIETDKLKKKKQVITEMIAKYSAVELDHISSEALTIEKQDVLLNTSGKPIFFYASLDDIVRTDNGYIAQLRSHRPFVLLELKCSLEQIDRIRSGERPKRIGVVAQISSVQKPSLKVEGYQDGEFAGVELDFSDVVVATGQCIDFVDSEYVEYSD